MGRIGLNEITKKLVLLKLKSKNILLPRSKKIMPWDELFYIPL